MKLNIQSIGSFPILKNLSPFYQNVLLSFYKSKCIKTFNKLNTSEVLSQPIWGNEYFKVKQTCLYLKEWIKCGKLYVKDLIKQNGEILTDLEMMEIIRGSRNIYIDILMIKQYVLKRIKDLDCSSAPYIKINNKTLILFENKWHDITNKTSRFFYKIRARKLQSKPHMQNVYTKEFGLDNNCNTWLHIYNQKLVDMKIIKLCEFNFKVLNNILPCGKILCKWNKGISENCTFCGELENTRHMLYECRRIKDIWIEISNILSFNVSWKLIVCGLPYLAKSEKVDAYNLILTILAYAIFKENSRCKFERVDFSSVNIANIIKANIRFYLSISNIVTFNNIELMYMNKILNKLS